MDAVRAQPGTLFDRVAGALEVLASREAAQGRDPAVSYRGLVAAVLGGLVGRLAAARGLGAVPGLGLPARACAPVVDDPALGLRGAGLAALSVGALGAVYESLLAMEPVAEGGGVVLRRVGRARKRSGSFYTPHALVEHLLDVALEPVVEAGLRERADTEAALLGVRVCDPACGSGNFVLAAARRLGGRLARARCAGRGPTGAELRRAVGDVVAGCVFGVDIDPVAAWLCRVGLWMECGVECHNIRVGDALLGAPAGAGAGEGVFDWGREFPGVVGGGGFDVVVGNPPFLSRLAGETAGERGRAAVIRGLTGGAVKGYADEAAAFLVRSVQLCRGGGRVGLVQPRSVLAARDAAAVRRAVLERGSLVSLWVSNGQVFGDAVVQTCAVVVEVGGARRAMVARSEGAGFASLPGARVDMDGLMGEETWSPLVAFGVPEVRARWGGTIGDIATATADFRDQYYGLDGFVVEGDEAAGDPGPAWPRVVTSGLIDLADLRWGRAPTRLLKRRWDRPRVDRERMEREGTLGAWMRARLVPKVLVATQTRVIEVVVDEAGELLPSTPVISVMAREGVGVWRVAAALASPVSCAEAVRRYGGAAMSAGAVKLSARQVCGLPAPADEAAWDEAAALLREAQCGGDRGRALGAFGRASNAAYGLTGARGRALLGWWLRRGGFQA